MKTELKVVLEGMVKDARYHQRRIVDQLTEETARVNQLERMLAGLTPERESFVLDLIEVGAWERFPRF